LTLYPHEPVARRHIDRFRRTWDWLLDLVISAWLGILDRLMPSLPERTIREDGERLRKAFLAIDPRSR
jgi:hypothetical protein